MPSSQDGKSVVGQLLMLGTPNGGAPLASLPVSASLLGIPLPTPSLSVPVFLPAVRELTVPFVTRDFNSTVTNRRNVPFAILAGDLIPTPAGLSASFFFRPGFFGIAPTLDLTRGDSVVPTESALNGYGTFSIADQFIQRFRLHTSMPGSRTDFDSFVVPRLARDPDEAGNNRIAQRLQSVTGELTSNSASTSQSPADLPQVFFNAAPELTASGSVEIDILVPVGRDFVISYFAPDTVGATLIAPDGSIAGTSPVGSDDAALFLRTFSIATPILGNYKLRLEQQGGTTGNVPIAALISGNPLTLDLRIGTPDSNQQSFINAILSNNGSPVTNATVVASIQGSEGSPSFVTLLDDGQNGDLQAGDGIYSGKTPTLTGGGYNVGVAAQGADFYRVASDSISIARPPEANLSLNQIQVLDPGTIDSDIVYTFEINNIGPNTATDVKLVQTLPVGVNFVSAPFGGTFNPSDRTVTINLEDLASDSSTVATVTVKRKVLGSLRSNATVSAVEADPDLSNNVVNNQGADLQIKRTTNPTTITLGQNYTYSLSVTNNGSEDATNVILTESLPDELIFVSSTAPVSFNNDDLEANLGVIRSGESRTVDFTVRSFIAGDLISLSNVAANEPDFNTANNFLRSTTTIDSVVPASADLQLSKTVNDTTPELGDQVTFNVILRNDGPGIASGIQVRDLLPSQLRFISSSPEQGVYDPTTGIWDVGNVRDNLSRQLTIVAEVVDSGSITNQAEVIAVNEADPDSTPGNNNPAEDDQAAVQLDVIALSGKGGRKTFTVRRGERVTISDFGGVGKGNLPSPAALAELDTLQLIGEGLMMRNYYAFISKGVQKSLLQKQKKKEVLD